MKLIAYQTHEKSEISDNSIKELISLCIKILQKDKTICILVQSREIASLINDKMWSTPFFIPHGLAWEDFVDIQPIVISTEVINRDILINFETTIIEHNKIQCPVSTFILWNCEPYSDQFEVFIQDQHKKWRKSPYKH